MQKLIVRKKLLIKAGLWSVILCLVVLLFHFLGNTVEAVHSRSVFVWMIARWSDKISFGTDYSHGWMIPLGSLFVLWRRREEIRTAKRSAFLPGLLLVAAALMLHVIGAKIQQPRVSLMGLILLLWALPLTFNGWAFARWFIFPCSFLIFCIPLNFLDAMTFPLRLVASMVSTGLLNGVGIATAREGCMILSSAGGGFHFDVADPCSGLRSLLALSALIAIYAHCTQRTLTKQWLMFLLSIPIAMGGNIARVTSIALVAVILGQERALLVYHDYSGYIVFVVEVLLMVGAGNLLKKDYGALRKIRPCAR